MQQCIVFVDPLSMLVLEVQQAQGAVLEASGVKFVGRPLTHWVVDPDREDLARILSVSLRSAEPRRFRATLRLAEEGALSVELSITAVIRSRNQSVLQVTVSALSPSGSVSAEKLTA